MQRNAPELGKRRQPVQLRAQESVDNILGTAAVLLDEVGIDGFNTNLLAQRANVRVRTVYRYFPNKYSVIVALTEKLSESWEEWMAGFYEALANPSRNWRHAIRRVREEWLDHAQSEPGSVAVLQAINASPELRELHDRIFETMCAKMVEALRKRPLKLPPARLKAISRATVSSLNAGVELYFRLSPRDAAPFLKELGVLQTVYLERYLDE